MDYWEFLDKLRNVTGEYKPDAEQQESVEDTIRRSVQESQLRELIRTRKIMPIDHKQGRP